MGRPASSRLHPNCLGQSRSKQGPSPARRWLQPLRSTTPQQHPPRGLSISLIQTESLMVKLDHKTKPDSERIAEQPPAFLGDCHRRLKEIRLTTTADEGVQFVVTFRSDNLEESRSDCIEPAPPTIPQPPTARANQVSGQLCLAQLQATDRGRTAIPLAGVIAIDTESVGVKPINRPEEPEQSAIAAVAIVGCQYEGVCHMRVAIPKGFEVCDYRTQFSGLTAEIMADSESTTSGSSTDPQRHGPHARQGRSDWAGRLVGDVLREAQYAFMFNASADMAAIGLELDKYPCVKDLPALPAFKKLVRFQPTRQVREPRLVAGFYHLLGRIAQEGSSITCVLEGSTATMMELPDDKRIVGVPPVHNHDVVLDAQAILALGHLVLPKLVWTDASRRRNAGTVWQRFLGIKASALQGLIFCLVF